MCLFQRSYELQRLLRRHQIGSQPLLGLQRGVFLGLDGLLQWPMPIRSQMLGFANQLRVFDLFKLRHFVFRLSKLRWLREQMCRWQDLFRWSMRLPKRLDRLLRNLRRHPL